MSTSIQVNKQSVTELFESAKKKPFLIPEYQRPYAWEEEQVDTLFEDIWDYSLNYNNNMNDNYFLGSVVSFDNESGNQEIIDGQQRITTLFLLLRAILYKLESMSSGKEVTFLTSRVSSLIWTTDPLTGEADTKSVLLKSNVINNLGNQILQDILITGITIDGNKDNYSKNYNYFLQKIEDKSTQEPFKIFNFIVALLDGCILLPIKANSQDTALTIFSTLNDRGLALSDVDIFKAQMYNNLPSQERSHFITNWQKLIDLADQGDENIQNLFYYYMFYLRAKDDDKKTTTPGLRKYLGQNKFKVIKSPVIMDELKLIGEFWSALKVSNQSIVWANNKEIKKFIDVLRSYPNDFWKYPVVIFYLKYHKDIDFVNKFKVFLKKLSVDAIMPYILTPTANAIKPAILKLNSSIIHDTKPKFEFKVNMTDVKARYKDLPNNAVSLILKLLVYRKQDELLPDKWHIEHIFPKKYDSLYFNSSIENYIEMIGNKIPLESKLNIRASNNFFIEKRKEYAKSKIKVVNELGRSHSSWAQAEIESRTDRIANTISDLQKNYTDEYNQTVF